jgi:hypothetical protein
MNSEYRPILLTSSAAFNGPLGDVVKSLEGNHEADPSAVLIQALTIIGNIYGRKYQLTLGGLAQYSNLFTLLVGQTGRGKKGTSLGLAKKLVTFSTPQEGPNYATGIASGPGIVHALRDPGVVKTKKGEEIDQGVVDKRLVLIEEEFSSILRLTNKSSDTGTSAILRSCWDSENLQNQSKGSPETASDIHVSFIGHITPRELELEVSKARIVIHNGFMNRFLIFYSHTDEVVPVPRLLDQQFITDRLRLSPPKSPSQFLLGSIEPPIPINLEDKAIEKYRDFCYRSRPDESNGLFVRSRSQVLRLAMIYSIIDQSKSIEVKHIESALALWDYHKESVTHLFSKYSRDARKLLAVLKDSPKTRTDITRMFNNNKSTKDINRLYDELKDRVILNTKGGCEEWSLIGH